jgi:autophagy-related protein 9
MASNIFGRLAPASRGSRSFYEELRARDDDYDEDIEEQAGMKVDEENLNEHFHDYDVDQVEGLTDQDSRITVDSSAQPSRNARSRQAPTNSRKQRDPGPRWFTQDDDGDNDVPASLLVEPHEAMPGPSQTQSSQRPAGQNAIPGPATRRNRAQWEAAQAQQRLHQEETFGSSKSQPNSLMPDGVRGNAREQALWRWANITNLDIFMADVYGYYQGKGLWCILSHRALHLL